SPAMQQFLDDKRAVHDISRMLRKAIANGQATEPFEQMQRMWPPFSHPVARTNPVTGRKCLFVNGNWTARIEGLTEREHDALLPMLIEHIRSPELQCRFRWREGSIAFWDNRWVQHYAVPDYSGQRRVMHRVTIEGDRPVWQPPRQHPLTLALTSRFWSWLISNLEINHDQNDQERSGQEG